MRPSEAARTCADRLAGVMNGESYFVLHKFTIRHQLLLTDTWGKTSGFSKSCHLIHVVSIIEYRYRSKNTRVSE